MAHENAILKWRQLMGPTKVFRAHIESPNSIRGNIGLTDTRNSTHGSDSVENATQEIKFFFPEFIMKEWEEKGRPVTTFEGSLKKLQEENMYDNQS
ncbi:Nucleoside diphosphate kinase 6 [Armadillidium nasatum]|uniref:Nucleoside diphosphate kinase n=1 Tax=Armadillidium nasatum TaxID=96803 RepID=A0A5N5TKK5_9CRUS|nr:Nucleoside diphosphate kinase 6 [Armadillidium nasatum]